MLRVRGKIVLGGGKNNDNANNSRCGVDTVNGKKVFTLETISSDPRLPNGHLSISQIDTYLRCGKQYEFAYVKKIKSPPGVALVEGGSHHEVLNIENNCIIDNGEGYDTSMLIELFKDTFNDKAREITRKEWKLSKDTKDSVLVRGETFIKKYKMGLSRKIKPLYCERKYEALINGVPMMLFVDLQEKDRILDYKVVGSAKSQWETDYNSQLTLYSCVTGIQKVGFLCFVKTKDCPTVMVESYRNKNSYMILNNLVKSVSDSIKAGSFPECDPSHSFPCSEKWCGYWNLCRGKFMKEEDYE